MHIRFERAGGFLPSAMKLSHTVNSEELPPEQVTALEELVEKAGIAELAGRSAPTKARPDASHYRLTIDDENGTHTVEASDAEMPPSLRPLITWLTTQARKAQ